MTELINSKPLDYRKYLQIKEARLDTTQKIIDQFAKGNLSNLTSSRERLSEVIERVEDALFFVNIIGPDIGSTAEEHFFNIIGLSDGSHLEKLLINTDNPDISSLSEKVFFNILHPNHNPKLINLIMNSLSEIYIPYLSNNNLSERINNYKNPQSINHFLDQSDALVSSILAIKQDVSIE